MSGEYRLLVDLEVIEQVNALPLAMRRKLKVAFEQIGQSPDSLSDYSESSPRGIGLDVHLRDGFAIKYWVDFAGRHVKILELTRADA